ncbi:hypothetical protein ACJ41O_002297 [Fusarium nematophilum]
MIANKLAILTATAALFEQALAFNSHRYFHQLLQKRAMHTDWVTVWETVYVTAGQEPAPAATQPAAVENNQPVVEYVPTTTSTTVVVVPSAADNQGEADAPAPAPAPVQQTTLSQVIKPSKVAKVPAAKAPASTQEEAAAAEPTEAVYKEQQPSSTKAAAAPKKTTASSDASSGSSSGGSAGFSHKRGLAYNDADLANGFGSGCTNCGWGYNWDSSANGLDSKFNFIPTLWDDTDTHTLRFPDNVKTCLDNGAKAIFSFNEPDNGGQANLTPDKAAASHVKYLNKYAGQALISAPSISNSGLAGEGLQWLESFVSACEAQSEKCHYDFCSVHWYSEVEYGETLFEHLEKAHEVCGGKPVWLTEFAPFGSDEAIAAWLEETIPRLEKLEYLDAYAYWSVAQGSLMASQSDMSTYGKVYASA